MLAEDACAPQGEAPRKRRCASVPKMIEAGRLEWRVGERRQGQEGQEQTLVEEATGPEVHWAGQV